MFPDFMDHAYNQLIECSHYNLKATFPLFKSTVPQTIMNCTQFFSFQGCH